MKSLHTKPGHTPDWAGFQARLEKAQCSEAHQRTVLVIAVLNCNIHQEWLIINYTFCMQFSYVHMTRIQTTG